MDEYYDENEELDDSAVTVISVLSLVSQWFIRFGIFVAIVLVVYFLLCGKFLTLLLYVLGLIAAYFFGYFFMFLLDKFVGDD